MDIDRHRQYKTFSFPFPVILASASPRRHELLSRLVEEFSVEPAHLDEDGLTDRDPWVTAQRLAREKALAVRERFPMALVVAGDTVVAVEECGEWAQLAKPGDDAEAQAMLGRLSGRTHTVVTGVCLVWPGGMSAFTDSTKVTFRHLKPTEIEAYVATGEPFDKAGGYGWQGAAKAFIDKTEGSVTNVVGLPLERLEEALAGVQ
ncbi:MAG: septum formation protein Maf [Armatimonadetes bacterium]|nr:septum formation protein Maf [Armatimonadota bacterium]